MPRKSKDYRNGKPVLPIDEALFSRMQKALGVPLNTNVRLMIEFQIRHYNIARAVNKELEECRGQRGRPLDMGCYVLVDGLLDCVERAGLEVSASKHQKDQRRREDSERVPAFLRVAWDAVERPPVKADGFAGMATTLRKGLDRNAEERRTRRKKRREAQENYSYQIKRAWDE
jgi:hypothetical protein